MLCRSAGRGFLKKNRQKRLPFEVYIFQQIVLSIKFIEMSKISSSAFADTKPHYIILDGLRGVAAIMVLWYHIFEAYATSALDQIINHGYLAVDFFFILSGFVIGYAYDDRWKAMRIKDFFKRRIIRLHPMVVMGSLIGAAVFYLPDYSEWQVAKVTASMLLVATLMNAFLIPATPSAEIRGLGEMYPLNGPSWSLFFEYVGNILYAIFLRRLPTKLLAGLVGALAIGLMYFAIWNDGYMGVGWTMTPDNMIGGSLRLLFSFSAGLLLSRIFKPTRIRLNFWVIGLCIVLLTAMPRIGGSEFLWINGLYDSLCIIIVFPLLVLCGASSKIINPTTHKVCKLLGDISYPLYMVHYPFIYLYYAWVKTENLTFTESIYGALGVVFGSIILAYVCLKLYDEPIRKWLSNHCFKK